MGSQPLCDGGRGPWSPVNLHIHDGDTQNSSLTPHLDEQWNTVPQELDIQWPESDLLISQGAEGPGGSFGAVDTAPT